MNNILFFFFSDPSQRKKLHNVVDYVIVKKWTRNFVEEDRLYFHLVEIVAAQRYIYTRGCGSPFHTQKATLLTWNYEILFYC